MIKNKISLEFKCNDRMYEFICSSDSPLGEVYDALSAMRGFVVERIKDAEQKSPSECSDECQEQQA